CSTPSSTRGSAMARPAVAVTPDESLLGKATGNQTVRRLLRSPSAVAGLTIVVLLVLAGVLAPLLTPYDPEQQNLRAVLQAPTWTHPLGTDQLGRDILARILFGARLTLFIGAFAVAVGVVVGVPLGVI